MNLDEYLQNNLKGRERIAVANRPSDVVSCIHVYYTNSNLMTGGILLKITETFWICYSEIWILFKEE